jgi:hypothetical protein
MSSGHLGIGKEAAMGIFGGLALIIVFVGIGSFIAQSMSGGHGGGHAAPAAAEQAAPAGQ